MAEQFILPSATSGIVKKFLKSVKSCTITDLAHGNIGWNQNSRNQYDGMMGLNNQPAIVGRAGLPPHFYIEIPANTEVDRLTGAWEVVSRLSRGVSTLVGIFKALDQTSQGLWSQGAKHEALISELKKGNVSISIYHLDGVEVTQTERDQVNNFPKKQ